MSKPECFWSAGVITSDWTTLPMTDLMKDEDTCHACKGIIKKVCIDGSATKVGASCYAGWGPWTPDDHTSNGNETLKGREQSSDRAEVRALVAALEKPEEAIEVITDNQYVRDTAQYLATSGL
eukprot:2943458-Heterocapsa_arctica.AAC.1